MEHRTDMEHQIADGSLDGICTASDMVSDKC